MDKLIETTEALLSEIGEIVSNYQKEQQERDKTGENFNAFKVLRLQRDEERLHSAFIAELLNPHGSHGMKDSFLKLFKKVFIDECLNNYCDKDKWEFDTKNVIVCTEHSFENGRIDILIESPKERKGIIIENKIDACDQEEQLLRYDRFGKAQYHNPKNYQLIYLTPEGDEASEKSTNKNKDLDNRYIRASYKEDIMRWIKLCINKCQSSPIQTILQQYSSNLKDIFNMMKDESNIKRLTQVAICPQNIDATLAIIKHQESIRKVIIENFIKRIKMIALDKYGLECDTWGDLPNLEDGSGLRFYYSKKHWALFIGAERHLSSYSVFYGIIQRDEEKRLRITQKQLQEIEPVWNYQDKDYPLGRFNLSRHSATKKWYYWKDWRVIEDMAHKELAKWITETVFREVLEGDNRLHKNLLKHIERITKEG